MRDFTETPTCRSQVHCETCRARTPEGEAFRHGIEKVFNPPKDWECPFGVPWDFKGNAKIKYPAPDPIVVSRVGIVRKIEPVEPLKPVKPSQWPLAARALAKLAKPTDRGLGDVIERLAAKVGGNAYKRLAKRLGYDCGCGGRQARMNVRYPLPCDKETSGTSSDAGKTST